MKIKTLGSLLLGSSILMASNSFAGPQVNSSFLKGYDLLPHEQQVFEGNWFSTRTLTCKVRAKGNEANPIAITALKKRAVVNGLILPEGTAMTVVVHVGDAIQFEFDHRAKLGLTNNGEQLVNLDC